MPDARLDAHWVPDGAETAQVPGSAYRSQRLAIPLLIALGLWTGAAAEDAIRNGGVSPVGAQDVASQPNNAASKPSPSADSAPLPASDPATAGLRDIRYVGRVSDPANAGDFLAIVETRDATLLLRVGDPLLDYLVSDIAKDALSLRDPANQGSTHLQIEPARDAAAGIADSPAGTTVASSPQVSEDVRESRRWRAEDASGAETGETRREPRPDPPSSSQSTTVLTNPSFTSESGTRPTAIPSMPPPASAETPGGATALVAPDGMDISPPADDPAVSSPIGAHDEPMQMEISPPGDISQMFMEQPDPAVIPPGMTPAP